MKHLVAELEGAPLDAAVAKAEGSEQLPVNEIYQPSTNWQQGGPIIERERIVLWPVHERVVDDSGEEDVFADGWAAMHFGIDREKVRGYFSDRGTVDADESGGIFGPTPLIAAMRAFVASKLGAEVDL